MNDQVRNDLLERYATLIDDIRATDAQILKLTRDKKVLEDELQNVYKLLTKGEA